MKELIDGLNTSLINAQYASNSEYQVDLITNKNIKTITYLENNLSTCDEFLFSVAFITKSGVALLKPLLKHLEDIGIQGKIIAGDYLGFTEPQALRELNNFRNIDVRLNFSNNLHAKGYFFKQYDRWNVIVGSSNITQAALTSNNEWNLKVSTTLNGKLCDDIIREFHKLYSASKPLEDVIDDYEEFYSKQNKIPNNMLTPKELTPNEMQLDALQALNKCRALNNKRALVISATGTGKTYLAAFDVKSVNPDRMLFIVHRENIARAAMESFKNIIPDKTCGLYTGTTKHPDADYVFATIQTLAKDKHLLKFKPDQFQYIIFDEVHHIGAKTYLDVFNYFSADFTLGMSATPERNDDFNIFELFNYNIAYEIRLHDALKSNMLVPFHYYGIADCIDADQSKPLFEQLTNESRINQIIEKSNFYGYSGDKLHSLIFASSVKEVKFLEEEFNKRGIPAKGLSGETKEEDREHAIELFEEGIYEFLITVDIFNEGIDIKCVNQVIFLRETESSIIFIQQLGRGLRLHDGKEYLVVLDFIGNYKTDFLIPSTLSQNYNYEKEDLLRFVLSPSEFMPGETTIHFEEIAKEKLFRNIKKTNFSSQKKLIKHDFIELEKRLGRKPLLCDFYQHRLISPNIILNKYPTIFDLYESVDSLNLSIDDDIYNIVLFISKFLTPARRPHEFIILKELLFKEQTFKQLNKKIELYLDHNKNESEQTKNALKHLTVSTYTATYKGFKPIIRKNGEYYQPCFDPNNIYINDIINYNLEYFNDNYKVGYPNNIFSIYEKKDISKMFLFENYQGGNNVQGYKFNHEKNLAVAFITLSNESELDTHDDQILSRQFVQWYSMDNRYLSKDGTETNEAKLCNGEYNLYLFVQKNKSEPFYSFGKMKSVKGEEVQTVNGKSTKNKVKFILELEQQIPLELYNYLIK